MNTPIFKSFLMGGFECSTHRRRDGRRLDMIEATGHSQYAANDYRRLADLGIKTARDGIRWHLIESEPRKYDFSSAAAQYEAAENAGVQVVWDLFHYGYPEHLRIFDDEFPERFGELAEAFARYHRQMTDERLVFVPVNEISFFSWVAGEIGKFYPFAKRRGDELKLQLVRAAISAIDAVRSVLPDAVAVSSEPAVHVTPRPEEPWREAEAETYRRSQFQALDLLTGRSMPELGGREEYLDAIGINYYPHNQWFYPDREMIPLGDPLYRPLSAIISEISERYQRPIFMSETGTEDDARADWFRYVAGECRRAINSGVDLVGVCLYPIVNYPGWEDGRMCENGLWSFPDETGERHIYEPLASELEKLMRDRHDGAAGYAAAARSLHQHSAALARSV